ncbi:hypothetical protein [Helicobacter sp. 23-1045]
MGNFYIRFCKFIKFSCESQILRFSCDSQNLAFLFFRHCDANLDSPKQSTHSVIAHEA